MSSIVNLLSDIQPGIASPCLLLSETPALVSETFMNNARFSSDSIASVLAELEGQHVLNLWHDDQQISAQLVTFSAAPGGLVEGTLESFLFDQHPMVYQFPLSTMHDVP